MFKLSPLEQVGAVVILFQQVESDLVELIVRSWDHHSEADGRDPKYPQNPLFECARKSFDELVKLGKSNTKRFSSNTAWEFLFGNLGNLKRLAQLRNDWAHSHFDVDQVIDDPGDSRIIMQRTKTVDVEVPDDDPKRPAIKARLLHSRGVDLSDGAEFSSFVRLQKSSMVHLRSMIDLYGPTS